MPTTERHIAVQCLRVLGWSIFVRCLFTVYSEHLEVIAELPYSLPSAARLPPMLVKFGDHLNPYGMLHSRG